jgi:diacylglycerol kinase family enzyme
MSQIGAPNRYFREEGSGSRNRSERIVLIVNPRAAAGAAGARLDELKSAADRAFEQWEVKTTEGPRHATTLAAEAAAGGADIVASVGGDGTCHEVVNGLMDGRQARNRKTALALIPFGTGSDLQKTLKVPARLNEALWMAATGVTLPSDVGLTELRREGGRHQEHFINVAGFGANGEVVRRANAMDKSWGGTVTFLRATVQSTLAYKPALVRLRWSGPDGEGSWTGALTSCFVANGAYCGGGMWVGSGGTMQDGHLDVTVLPPAPFLRQMVEVRRLYDGSVGRFPGALRFRATAIEAEVEGGGPVYLDLDGENPGELPVRFELLPRALPIRGGWLRST